MLYCIGHKCTDNAWTDTFSICTQMTISTGILYLKHDFPWLPNRQCMNMGTKWIQATLEKGVTVNPLYTASDWDTKHACGQMYLIHNKSNKFIRDARIYTELYSHKSSRVNLLASHPRFLNLKCKRKSKCPGSDKAWVPCSSIYVQK